MNSVNIVLLVIAIITFILSIVFLVLYVRKSNTSVSNKNVPKIASGYAVIPNVSSVKTQYTCSSSGTADGQVGTSACIFQGVDDVNMAIDNCNKYSFTGNLSFANCNGFIFKPQNSEMIIISTGYPISSDSQDSTTNGDVYLKQNNFV